MTDDDRTRAAYHESGHFAISWLRGRRVSRISIVPDGDSLGRTLYADSPPVSADALQAEIRSCWAEARTRGHGKLTAILETERLLGGVGAEAKWQDSLVIPWSAEPWLALERLEWEFESNVAATVFFGVWRYVRGRFDEPALWHGVDALAGTLREFSKLPGSVALRVFDEAVNHVLTEHNEGGY